MANTNTTRNWNLGLAALLAGAALAIGGAATASASNDVVVDKEATLYVALADCNQQLAADVNCDGQVSGYDLFELIGHMGARTASGAPTGPNTDFPWDINGDGGVSGLDLFALLRDFGKHV